MGGRVVGPRAVARGFWGGIWVLGLVLGLVLILSNVCATPLDEHYFVTSALNVVGKLIGYDHWLVSCQRS